MENKFFRSFFAVAMLLGAALGFVACEEKEGEVVGDPTIEVSAKQLNFTNEEGSQIVDITANSDWKVENKIDWVTVTPMAGSGDGKITIAVSMNDTGAIREGSFKVHVLNKKYDNLEWDTKSIKVSQSADETPTVEEVLLYGDNFDGKEATKTYGSGSSWPYIDQFPDFANAKGEAAANVTYTGKGVSVRANSTSNSNYSDYAGSGSNNIFFGSNANFEIHNIAPLNADQASYKLTFGSEKYTQDGDSTFRNDEFKVYLSQDGTTWVPVEYEYAGTEPGRWNVATANFTFVAVPETLYIKFTATVASVYRLDDVKLFTGNGGQSIDLTQGEEPVNPDQPGTPDGPNVPSNGIYESDSAFVCIEDDSENAVYSLGATTIGSEAVTGFKLGKSKQAGKFTSGTVGVDGDKYLNFYAQGWKGGDVTLYFRVNGGVTMSQKLASHDGASNNPPYTALSFAETDHYSIKLEGLTATSQIEFSTDANFELTTADSTMASARAIVAGVKLSDEPIGAETPGGGEEPENPTPEQPTPGDVVTIAEVLALGQGAALNGTIEAVVISNYELNNLTSKKGMYVQDETGALQLRLDADHTIAHGTKVQIDLAGTTLGAYSGAVQVSISSSNITVVSTGNTVTPKTVTVADFLANKYEGQYIALEGVQVASSDLANTWVMGGAHTSINMECSTGDKFVVFSSKYATYGAETVAQGAGVIKGISSINNGTIQIIFAQASDYAGLTGERFDGSVTPEQPEQPEQPENPTPEQPEPGTGATATIYFDNVANRTVYTTEQQVWVQNGITVTNDKASSQTNVGDYYNPARFYKSSDVTIAADAAFSQIIFNCDDYKTTYPTDLQSSISSGSVTVDGTVVTVTLSSAATSYAITGLAGQVRVDSITVVYAE